MFPKIACLGVKLNSTRPKPVRVLRLRDLLKTRLLKALPMTGGTETLTEKLIMEEIGSLNEDFAFPNKLTVAVEECGEPNAFYNPDEVRVVMCTENAEWLRYLPLPE